MPSHLTSRVSRNVFGHALLLVALISAPALAADTVHLSVKANGTSIEGESMNTSAGREGTIQCFSFRTGGLRMTNPPAPREQRKVTVTCRKAIDQATPLLITAMAMNHTIEMTARFYRLSRTGDGTTEQHYTVVGVNGRISSIKQLSPDTLNPSTAQSPVLEELTIEFPSVTFQYGTYEALFPG